MKIFNWTFGTFFRTLGRILAYIAIGVGVAYLSGFLNIASVNAASVIYTNNLKVPTWAYFTNCSTKDNCWVDFGSTYNVGGVVPWWTTTNTIMTTGSGAGIGLTIYLEEGFLTGNYYTVNVLVDVSTDAIPISKTSNTKVVGVGSTELQAYQHASSSISHNSMTHVTGRFTYDMEYLDLTTTASYLTYTFKAVTTGNFLFMTLTTETTTTGRWDVYGYEYINHGAIAPTTDEIQQALQTNFDSINNNISNSQNSINSNINSSTSSINSNINNATSSINNNIDSMKEKQDTTNKELGEMNDNITNSDSSEATGSAGDFFSGFSTDTFGLTSIITAPLNLIGSITSSTCSSVPLSIPYVDTTLSLPCLSSIYEKHFGAFLTIYQTITFGIVAYWVCVRVFALVKDFKNPDHDEVEVLEL